MDENESQDVATEEAEDTDEVAEADKTTEEKPKAAKPKRTPEEELAYFEGRVKRLQKDLGKSVESRKEEAKTQTGELDETALDYLDLKGISEAEDIKIIEDVFKKTGKKVREILNDDYVKAKLTANKEKRDVKSATPSSTKRGGGTGDTLDVAIAKYEQSGYKDLPADFALRSAVINAVSDRKSTNKPAWH